MDKGSVIAAMYLPAAHTQVSKDDIGYDKLKLVIPGKHLNKALDFYNSPYYEFIDLNKIREVCYALAVIIFIVSRHESKRNIFNIYMPLYLQKQEEDLKSRLFTNQFNSAFVNLKPLKILTINCLARLNQLAFPNATYTSLVEKSKNIISNKLFLEGLNSFPNDSEKIFSLVNTLSRSFQETDILPISQNSVNLFSKYTPNSERGLFKRRIEQILTKGIDKCIQEDGSFFDLFFHPEPVNIEETSERFFQDLWQKKKFHMDIQMAFLITSVMHENFHAITNYHYFRINEFCVKKEENDIHSEIFSLLYYMEQAIDLYIDEFPREKNLSYLLSIEERYANIFSIDALNIIAKKNIDVELAINPVEYINSRLSKFGMLCFERPSLSSLRPMIIGSKKRP